MFYWPIPMSTCLDGRYWACTRFCFKYFRRVNKKQFDKKIWQVSITFWQVVPELCRYMCGGHSIPSSDYIIACPEGTYGKDCSMVCKGYCKNGCNHVNGKCDNGCDPGWHTFDCSEGKKDLVLVQYSNNIDWLHEWALKLKDNKLVNQYQVHW